MGIPSSNAATLTPPAHDQATDVLAGTFAATGQSGFGAFWGSFNVQITGGAATVQLERSFDGGATFAPFSQPANFPMVFVAPNVSMVVYEPEQGVNYRLNCTAYTSGTVTYRISCTGAGARDFAPTY